MGIYSEYINQLNGSFEAIEAERKKQLKAISALRGNRSILTIAADFSKGNAPISIEYADILAIADQLDNLSGNEIDIILETPGGSGEVAEDIVKLIRGKFSNVGFIIPGAAKSAGTIMVMSGDEILMEPASSLGPIDAQVSQNGKVFSAHAFLEGLEKIKSEVQNTQTLNMAYIPILQGISPGEIQRCENALNFAKVLVTNWLANYKFKDWNIHSSTGIPVTSEEKENRAAAIAENLCNHSYWLTHGRSIKINDLRQMRLTISDYSENAPLYDAIRRYHTLMTMTFSGRNIYKLFETPESQIYRGVASVVGKGGGVGIIDIECQNCKHPIKLQFDFGQPQPLEKGAIKLPPDNKLLCPNCNKENDLTAIRNSVEAQAGQKTV